MYTNNFLLLVMMLLSCIPSYMYEFKCPEQLERRLRARQFCERGNSSAYQCLYDTLEKKAFIERCAEDQDYAVPGKKYVISGQLFDEECSNNTYQPFSFWSNISHGCLFIKSACSDEGQMLWNNQTNKEDRLCTCDISKRYNFVTSLKNCSCNPSIEDCSCYSDPCLSGSHLSPDYECTDQKRRCPKISVHDLRRQHKLIRIFPLSEAESIPAFYAYKRRVLTVPIVLIIIAVLYSTCFGILIGCNILTDAWLITLQIPRDLKATGENNEIKLIWTPPMKCICKLNGYRIEFTDDDWNTKREEDLTKCCNWDLKKVSPSTTYRFKVYACFACFGKSVESEPSETTYDTGKIMSPKELTCTCENGQIELTWSHPDKNMFRTKGYRIKQTVDELNTEPEVETVLECYKMDIKNVYPSTTYRFKVYAYSEEGYESEPSETKFITEKLKPPKDLTAKAANSKIALAWSPPSESVFKLEEYRIEQTIDELNTEKKEFVTKECKKDFPNIEPSTTYRFQVYARYACSTKIIESEPSYTIYMTGEIKQVKELLADGEKNNTINLKWTAAPQSEFKTVMYKIELSTEGRIQEENVGPEITEWNSPTVEILKTYCLKVYTCTFGSFKSIPNMTWFVADSTCFKTEFEMTSENYTKNLRRKNSSDYKRLRNKLTDTIEKAYKESDEVGGEQRVKDINFRDGSVIAEVLIFSKDFHDLPVLRRILENQIKTGKIGRFETSKTHFLFRPLNRPVAPKKIEAHFRNGNICISWCAAAETFFSTEHYKIKFLTSDGKESEISNIPAKTLTWELVDALPSTRYSFNLITCIHHDIESTPSSDAVVSTEAPLPVQHLRAVRELEGKSIKLCWKDPSYPASKHIQHYEVVVNSGETYIVPRVQNVLEQFYIYNLKRGDIKVLKFTVSLITKNNTKSEKSQEVECNIEKPPQPPRNVKFSKGVILEWSNPTRPIQHYIKYFIIYLEGPEGIRPFPVPKGTTKYDLTRYCKPSSTYGIRITTCSNEDFESLPSETLTFRTEDHHRSKSDSIPPETAKPKHVQRSFSSVQ